MRLPCKPEESLLNKSEIATFTNSYKWKNGLSLRSLGYFLKNKIYYQTLTQNRFITGEQPIIYTENPNVSDINQNLYANVELKYFNKKNWYTTLETEFKNAVPNWGQNILLNDNLVLGASNSRQTNFNNHLNLTYQASEGLLWENYAYFSFSKTEQYFAQNGIDFLRNQEGNLNQTSRFKQAYAGWNSRLRLKNTNRTINFKLGIEKENDEFLSSLELDRGNVLDSLQINRNISFLNVNEQSSYIFHLNEKRHLKL